MNQVNQSSTQLRKAKDRMESVKIHPSIEHNMEVEFHGISLLLKGVFTTRKHFILEESENLHYQVLFDDVYFALGIIDKPTVMVHRNLTKPREEREIEIKLRKVNDIDYDPSMFIPMVTGKPIDLMFSSAGGIFPACNYIVIGDPGIGKSTLLLDILASLKDTHKVLFISGEMTAIDMKDYCRRYPKFGDVTTLFMSDYDDDEDNPKAVIEQTLEMGWDLVLIDSFVEVQDSVASVCGISTKKAEKWLIDLMVKHNGGGNKENKYTSFLPIQQMTKGGTFVGSNKLKHNTTGMLEIRYSNEFSGDRYIKPTKNRRGFKYERLFFSLDSAEEVTYDEVRLKRDLDIKERISKERDSILADEEKFNNLFLNGNNENDMEDEA